MTHPEILATDLAEAATRLRARDEPFVFATVVRTAGATSARPGAKALIGADGTILHGFLGGGCIRGAVRRAALAALESGAPQLVEVAPEDLLTEMGVAPGATANGVTYARNGCPSRGTVDIFIEPCLPMPGLAVLGNSPVAHSLAALAPQFHWAVSRDISGTAPADPRAIVVATQGQGDLDALRAALRHPKAHIAFVGSTRKFETLAARLTAEGLAADQAARISAPAGLDIGAVTPEEIALSILAELILVRRKGTAGRTTAA